MKKILLLLSLGLFLWGCNINQVNEFMIPEIIPEELTPKIKEEKDDEEVETKNETITENKTALITRVNEAVYNGKWKEYKHTPLGLSFKHPEEWGKAITHTNEHITDLQLYNRAWKDRENNGNQHNIRIGFLKVGVGWFYPNITLYTNEYKGEDDWHSPHKMGKLDNRDELQNLKNICELKILAEPFPHNGGYTYEEIWSKCSNGVKTIFSRKKETFSSPYYSYYLKMHGSIKGENGLFDNIFITDWVGDITQSVKNNLTIEEFISRMEKPINLKEREEGFAKFIKSFETFKPEIQKKLEIKITKGEDPNTIIIKRYYNHIQNGELDEAYAYLKKGKISKAQFEEWYGQNLTAEPENFAFLGNNTYLYEVDYQDHNTKPTLYRVKAQVNEGKIETLSSDQIIEEVTFNNELKAAFIRRNKKNMLVITQENKENILKSTDSSWEESRVVNIFRNIQFSKSGRYLIYTSIGHEWGAETIYDIQSKHNIYENFAKPILVNNESHFYNCLVGPGGMSAYPMANVYELPSGKLIQETKLKNKESTYELIKKCSFNEKLKTLTVEIEKEKWNKGFGQTENLGIRTVNHEIK